MSVQQNTESKGFSQLPQSVGATSVENSRDSTSVKDEQTSGEDGDSGYPEGGLQAWLVAAGAAGSFFCTLGYTNVFGIFQAYYKFNQLPDTSADAIAWIGSIQSFLIFAIGAVGGPLFDRYGAWIIRPAAMTYILSIMLTSLCTEYWHFMLCQGILTGVSNGLVLFPSLAAVPQYFDKRRGAAMGLSIAGSSLGAVIFPIVLSELLDTNLGFGWSVRITAFIMLPVLTFSALAVRSRLPPRKTGFFIASSFSNKMYIVLIMAMFFSMIGMFVPLFLIPTYAITQGMSESLANYLVAVINGASIFGRIIPGILADKLGRLNLLIAAALTTGIIIFCWPVATSTAGIIVLAAAFGFCSGAIISGGSVAMTLCADKPENVGTYMGMGMAMASFSALVGPPVSGKLIESYGFWEASWFSGALTLFGALLATVVKGLSPKGLMANT